MFLVCVCVYVEEEGGMRIMVLMVGVVGWGGRERGRGGTDRGRGAR